MARKEFLDYVWTTCIEPQLGYSFSLNHTLPYSVVAVQEMNLATRYNPLYWTCACLCVNSGNYVGEMGEEDSDEDNIEVEEDEDSKEKKTAPNYGKISKAISDVQLQGVEIELPDINKAQMDFVPDINANSILYSLHAVTVVSDDLAECIMNNRPYSSMKDFYERIEPTNVQMIGLIKAGCFDALEGKNRRDIMRDYLIMVAERDFPLKEKITGQNLGRIMAIHMPLKDFIQEVRFYKFKKYIDANQYDKANKRYVITEENVARFTSEFILEDLKREKNEYSFEINDNGTALILKQSAFERVYKKKLEPLMAYLNTPEGLESFRKSEIGNFIEEQKEKYCAGSIAAWEFGTMSFYHEPHELARVRKETYGVKEFNDLPEYPPEDQFDANGRKLKKKLCSLMGTVTSTDNNKHIVSILTLTGVVNVKFFASAYTQFNQKISKLDPNTKKKTIIDDSFFKRGNKILVYGERRENMFTAKKNYDDHGRMVGLIEQVYENGTLGIRFNRRDNL